MESKRIKQLSQLAIAGLCAVYTGFSAHNLAKIQYNINTLKQEKDEVIANYLQSEDYNNYYNSAYDSIYQDFQNEKISARQMSTRIEKLSTPKAVESYIMSKDCEEHDKIDSLNKDISDQNNNQTVNYLMTMAGYFGASIPFCSIGSDIVKELIKTKEKDHQEDKDKTME